MPFNNDDFNPKWEAAKELAEIELGEMSEAEMIEYAQRAGIKTMSFDEMYQTLFWKWAQDIYNDEGDFDA